MTLIAGGIDYNTTITPTEGQDINFTLCWTYPNSNAPEYEGEEQPTEPPIELASMEFRFTPDERCLVNPDDQEISWIYFSKGTTDAPTADFNEITQEWEGKEDQTRLPELPVATRWYYQARTWSRLHVPSDWTEVQTRIDTPEPLPVPEIIELKTNEANQVLVIWEDVAGEIPNFSHYEIIVEEIDVSHREEVSAVIVGN